MAPRDPCTAFNMRSLRPGEAPIGPVSQKALHAGQKLHMKNQRASTFRLTEAHEFLWEEDGSASKKTATPAPSTRGSVASGPGSALHSPPPEPASAEGERRSCASSAAASERSLGSSPAEASRCLEEAPEAPAAVVVDAAAARKEARAAFDAAAREAYMEAFRTCGTSTEVMHYKWPEYTEALPAAPAAAAEAPAPKERPMTADQEREVIEETLKEARGAGNRAPRPVSARAHKAEHDRKGRKPFRCGSWKQPKDALRLPRQPKNPLDPPPRPRRAPEDPFAIHLPDPAPTVLAETWPGQAEELALAKSVTAEGARAPRRRPKKRGAKPRPAEALRPLEPSSFTAACDVGAPPLPPSVEAEAARLDRVVARALGGDVPAFGGARSPQLASGSVLSHFRADDGAALAELGREKKREVFEDLCAAAGAHGLLPVYALLRLADGGFDNPVLDAVREYPALRDAVAGFEPQDALGVCFDEFEEMEEYFAELIASGGARLSPDYVY